MGAYENPQAVIDTGTPQILANTISNVGKTAAQGLANELKKQQDWLTYTYKFSSQEYDKVEAQLEKNKISTEIVRYAASNTEISSFYIKVKNDFKLEENF